MEDVYISPESQKRLLKLSRQTLEDFVRGSPRGVEPVDDPYLQSQDYGVFVSLHNKDELRGCIGTCAPTTPLYETVIEMTEAAASRDHRVAPVCASEIDQIRIDISLLSPLEKSDDPMSLQVGKHGLHIAHGGHGGLLLPQVATEHDWDMKSFLEHTCIKAGLPKDAWQWPDTLVSSFSALIIEEAR